MLIGELSRRTGVSTRLLRYYEEQGLLTPDRDGNGYRRYCPDTADTVVRIRGLLAAGLSSDVIRNLLPCAPGTGPGLVPCDEVLGTLREQLAAMDASIAELQRRREALACVQQATDEARTTAALAVH